MSARGAPGSSQWHLSTRLAGAAASCAGSAPSPLASSSLADGIARRRMGSQPAIAAAPALAKPGWHSVCSAVHCTAACSFDEAPARASSATSCCCKLGTLVTAASSPLTTTETQAWPPRRSTGSAWTALLSAASKLPLAGALAGEVCPRISAVCSCVDSSVGGQRAEAALAAAAAWSSAGSAQLKDPCSSNPCTAAAARAKPLHTSDEQPRASAQACSTMSWLLRLVAVLAARCRSLQDAPVGAGLWA